VQGFHGVSAQGFHKVSTALTQGLYLIPTRLLSNLTIRSDSKTQKLVQKEIGRNSKDIEKITPSEYLYYSFEDLKKKINQGQDQKVCTSEFINKISSGDSEKKTFGANALRESIRGFINKNIGSDNFQKIKIKRGARARGNEQSLINYFESQGIFLSDEINLDVVYQMNEEALEQLTSDTSKDIIRESAFNPDKMRYSIDKFLEKRLYNILCTYYDLFNEKKYEFSEQSANTSPEYFQFIKHLVCTN